MTFKKEVRTGVTMNAFPAILKKGSARLQLIELGVFYFGKEGDAKIYADGRFLENAALKFGYNSINVGLQPVTEATPIELKVVAW